MMLSLKDPVQIRSDAIEQLPPTIRKIVKKHDPFDSDEEPEPEGDDVMEIVDPDAPKSHPVDEQPSSGDADANDGDDGEDGDAGADVAKAAEGPHTLLAPSFVLIKLGDDFVSHQLPNGLRQHFALIPVKQRLIALAAFIRWKAVTEASCKMIIFCSTTDSVGARSLLC